MIRKLKKKHKVYRLVPPLGMVCFTVCMPHLTTSHEYEYLIPSYHNRAGYGPVYLFAHPAIFLLRCPNGEKMQLNKLIVLCVVVCGPGSMACLFVCILN